MKFLERVFDPLGDKQVPLMALATSAAGEVGSLSTPDRKYISAPK
jgi:hypothetical protein